MNPALIVPLGLCGMSAAAILIAWFIWWITERGPEWRIVEWPAREHPFVVEQRAYSPYTFGRYWQPIAQGKSRQEAEEYIREKISAEEHRTVAEFDAKGKEVKQ